MTKQKLTWTLREAAWASGLSVPFLRKEIDAGRLKTLRVGIRRILIADHELRRWLGLPEPSEKADTEHSLLLEHRDVM